MNKENDKRTICTPQEFQDLQRECIERVKFHVQKANQKCGINLPVPKVVFSVHGTTAGRAYWMPSGKHEIRFNPVLLRDNVDEFLNRTPGHEVAHLASYMKYGTDISPHGFEWGKVMWMLGLPAIRCHNYDTTNVAGRGQVPRRKVISVNKTDYGTVRQIGIGRIIEFD